MVTTDNALLIATRDYGMAGMGRRIMPHTLADRIGRLA